MSNSDVRGGTGWITVYVKMIVKLKLVGWKLIMYSFFVDLKSIIHFILDVKVYILQTKIEGEKKQKITDKKKIYIYIQNVYV